MAVISIAYGIIGLVICIMTFIYFLVPFDGIFFIDESEKALRLGLASFLFSLLVGICWPVLLIVALTSLVDVHRVRKALAREGKFPRSW